MFQRRVASNAGEILLQCCSSRRYPRWPKGSNLRRKSTNRKLINTRSSQGNYMLDPKWMYGAVVLYCMPFFVVPFLLMMKIKGGIYTLPSHLSHGARDLIPQMLVVEPMKRMTIPEIRQHSYGFKHIFQDI
ncbi:hypothetical protein V6N13_068532 [Hibiscus sabdariffa]